MNSGHVGWQQSVDPRALRCSDAEREPVVDFLKQAYAEGRLDESELDMRVHLAMTAKTRGDLDAVLVDLAPRRQQASTDLAVRTEPTSEDRVLAALAHASGYFTTFVGPLIFLLVAGGRSAYVRRHAAEALNFQITILLVVLVTFGLGTLLYLVSWILCGIAALSALAGSRFRYPWILRLVK